MAAPQIRQANLRPLPPDPGDSGWQRVERRRKTAGMPLSRGSDHTRTMHSRSVFQPGMASQTASGNSSVPGSLMKLAPITVPRVKRSWSCIVSNNNGNPNFDLEFVDQPSSEPVVITADDRASATAMWKNSLVLYVVGARPYFVRLNATLRKLWNLHGDMELYARDNGFFIARMSLESDCDKVINSGPWMIDGKLLIVRRWLENITLDKDLLDSVPIWIRLLKLPLSIWNAKAISKISSKVGRPIRMDENTTNCSRISYARLLVEISFNQDLPDEVLVQIDGGDKFKQPVIYEKLPPRCKVCEAFGHTNRNCSVAKNLVWVAKENYDSVLVGSSVYNSSGSMCVQQGVSDNTKKTPGVSSKSTNESTQIDGLEVAGIEGTEGTAGNMELGVDIACSSEAVRVNPPFFTSRDEGTNIGVNEGSIGVAGSEHSIGDVAESMAHSNINRSSEDGPITAGLGSSIRAEEMGTDKSSKSSVSWQEDLIEQIQKYKTNRDCGDDEDWLYDSNFEYTSDIGKDMEYMLTGENPKWRRLSNQKKSKKSKSKIIDDAAPIYSTKLRSRRNK